MNAEAPVNTIALCNSASSWMTGDLFLKVMEHFIKFSYSSKENPSLLIFDNHESHLTPEVINLARDHLTIPPHCSQTLQPLNVVVYKSLKKFYDSGLDS